MKELEEGTSAYEALKEAVESRVKDLGSLKDTYDAFQKAYREREQEEGL